ncbi:MAG: chemotaxis protein [Pseudomonadales bacterium RIFCSPLOWO2_12_59_9]|uniref:chemotaxis protein CheW n=1 Tax=Pseudomonas sp. TaxID=306 RepID=UPI0008D54492|nr:chemotaxis protein CheW [Pseudomonas sp.]OHC25789.1 MAG: chemotaxis protein [Pseudomonadales bacterium RIFCSPLOWO2_12_59_9]
MSQAVASPTPATPIAANSTLTGLMVPLTDRTLLLPNVAVAELLPYRAPTSTPGMPAWMLGQIAWRDLRLPLLSFEAASDGQSAIGPNTRVAVINALGGRPQVKFLALLVQGIPRSIKLESNLARANVHLAPLELDAVSIGDGVLKIPDLIGLEQLLADAGLI